MGPATLLAYLSSPDVSEVVLVGLPVSDFHTSIIGIETVTQAGYKTLYHSVRGRVSGQIRTPAVPEVDAHGKYTWSGKAGGDDGSEELVEVLLHGWALGYLDG